jgi:hypothetical protein
MNASSMRRSNSIGYACVISRTVVRVSNARRRSGPDAYNARSASPRRTFTAEPCGINKG